MRLVRHHAYGEPSVLVVDEVPEPVPGPAQLAVAVEAAGVTLPAVTAVATGDPAALPIAPAGEVCGRVTAIGDGIDPGWLGRRVAGTAFGAAYADVALLDVRVAVAVPGDVDAPAAVALVRGGQVALGALRLGDLDGARRVLVTGAAGGVGHLAVQLARAPDRHVTAVVSTPALPAKAAALRELGADAVVTDDDAPWEPADLILDGVGGDVQDRALAALAPGGRLVVYNGVGGRLDTNELRARHQSALGFAMSHLVRTRPETFGERAGELWARHQDGELRPRTVIFPLAEAARAHAVLRAREGVGKCVVHVADPR